MKTNLTELLKIVGPIEVSEGVLSYHGGKISLAVERNCKVPISKHRAECLLREKNRFMA